MAVASIARENQNLMLKDVVVLQYVSEAVGAIMEAPVKSKDIWSMVTVLSLLHRRYEESRLTLMEHQKQILYSDTVLVGRKRIHVRLFLELFRVGVYDSALAGEMVKLVNRITTLKIEPHKDGGLDSLSLVNTLVKYGGPMVIDMSDKRPGLAIEKEALQAVHNGNEETKSLLGSYEEEIEKEWKFPQKYKDKLQVLVNEYYKNVVEDLLEEFKNMQEMEKKNFNIINVKGDISDKRKEMADKTKASFDQFLSAVATLAETLGHKLPEMKVLEDTQPASIGKVELKDNLLKQSFFEDEDERLLYEDLPSLRGWLPNVLLDTANLSQEKIKALEEEFEEDNTDENLAIDDFDEMSVEESIEEGEVQDGAHSISEIILKLPECVSIELCDSFCLDFCLSGGGKEKRLKQLAAALTRPPFGALQLLPFYSRIAATLSQEFPIIAEQLIKFLQREFFGLKKKVDVATDTLEPRLRNASYMAELVKFGIYPAGKAFVQLKSLLEDFSRHNIDTACCFIESCGRYLYLRPDTSVRMKNMTMMMLKMRQARNLDSRHTLLIDSAVASLKKQKHNHQNKDRGPMKEYIRHLIYNTLNKRTLNHVKVHLMKMRWNEVELYVVKIVMGAVRKSKTNQIGPLSALVEKISVLYPSFGVLIVDTTIEEIMCGLEITGQSM